MVSFYQDQRHLIPTRDMLHAEADAGTIMINVVTGD